MPFKERVDRDIFSFHTTADAVSTCDLHYHSPRYNMMPSKIGCGCASAHAMACSEERQHRE